MEATKRTAFEPTKVEAADRQRLISNEKTVREIADIMKRGGYWAARDWLIEQLDE